LPAVPPLRVASVYRADHCPNVVIAAMNMLRLFRMSEALARRGHEVDIVINRSPETRDLAPRLREVPFRLVRWGDYDVVKTFFHRGFDSLRSAGGADHPFIVSKLGSVVGRTPMEGVYFYGAVHEHLFQTQLEIARHSRAVTVLTERSAALWRREHGAATPLLRVPTGVEAEIPPRGDDPYRRLGINEPIAIFAGNIYSRETQPEVNILWQDRLNRIGRLLRRRGVRLVAMGTGDPTRLDPDAVLHVGVVDAHAFWDWQRHARVGLVLAQGEVQDNESSKIYYYLRTGLPVVCDRPVPNAGLIEETGLGTIVDYGDDEAMAAAACRLVARPPVVDDAIERIVRDHSWDARAALYDDLFAQARREASTSRRTG
jgi:glycosyltransferase involved in cell wall biosynthesis